MNDFKCREDGVCCFKCRELSEYFIIVSEGEDGKLVDVLSDVEMVYASNQHIAN